MDPISAICNAIVALANCAAEIVKSQPPNVSADIWNRLDDHIKWLRSIVKLPPT